MPLNRTGEQCRKSLVRLPVILSKHSNSTINAMEELRTSPKLPSHLPPRMTARMFLREIPPTYSRRQLLEKIDEVASIPGNLFTRAETSVLLQLFLTNAKQNGINGGMLYSEFRVLLFGTLDITDPNTLDGLCRAAAISVYRGRKKCERLIQISGFITTLSTLIRGDFDSRAALAFEILDIDTDGLLQAHLEIKRMLKRCVDIDNPPPEFEDDPFEAIRDFNRYIQQFFGITSTSPMNLKMFTALVKEKPWLLDMALPILPEPYSTVTFEYLFGHRVLPEP